MSGSWVIITGPWWKGSPVSSQLFHMQPGQTLEEFLQWAFMGESFVPPASAFTVRDVGLQPDESTALHAAITAAEHPQKCNLLCYALDKIVNAASSAR